LAHPPPFLPNEGDRLCHAGIFRRNGSEDQARMAERKEFGRYTVGQPPLLANFPHQTAAKSAAAEDIIDEAHSIPIQVVALWPDLSEGDSTLRHRPAGNQHAASLGRLRVGDRGLVASEGQPAEYPVDQ